jgi:hypothetical protein
MTSADQVAKAIESQVANSGLKVETLIVNPFLYNDSFTSWQQRTAIVQMPRDSNEEAVEKATANALAAAIVAKIDFHCVLLLNETLHDLSDAEESDWGIPDRLRQPDSKLHVLSTTIALKHYGWDGQVDPDRDFAENGLAINFSGTDASGPEMLTRLFEFTPDDEEKMRYKLAAEHPRWSREQIEDEIDKIVLGQE